MTNKILAFAGSLRKDSYNKQLVQIALQGAEQEGVAVTYIDLNDYPLPLYDGDIEAKGLPDPAKQLKELFWSHGGLLISTPEYNSGVPPVLKNVIDWVSRPSKQNEAFLSCYQNKVVALISASPSPLGGRRAFMQLRTVLQNINCLVIPETYHAEKVMEGFGDEERIKRVGTKLAQVLKKMAPVRVS